MLSLAATEGFLPVTFLNTRYRLMKCLTPKQLERLSRLSTVYGVRGLSLEEKDLIVEYDASRLHEAEVLAAIRSASVEPEKPIPLGRFDYTGEFKDFAWPTTGLSPVNQRQE
jgi:hypothetical protein